MIVYCEDCMWWLHTSGDCGQCHYNPPQPLNENAFSAVSIWPITKRKDFCKEGQKND